MWLAGDTHLWLVGWGRKQQGSSMRSFGSGISKEMRSILSMKVGKDVRDWRGKEELGNAASRAWWCIEWGEDTWRSGVSSGAWVMQQPGWGQVCSMCACWLVGVHWGVTRSHAGRRHRCRVCWWQCGGGRAWPWVWLGRRPGSSCWKAGLFIPQIRCIMDNAVTGSTQLRCQAFLSYPKDVLSTT